MFTLLLRAALLKFPIKGKNFPLRKATNCSLHSAGAFRGNRDGGRETDASATAFWLKSKGGTRIKSEFHYSISNVFNLFHQNSYSISPLKGKQLGTCCGFLSYTGNVTAARGWSLLHLIRRHQSSSVSRRRCRSCQ